MAKQTDLFLTKKIINAGTLLENADGTGANLKLVYTATSDDAVVKGLMCVSTDTSPVNLRIILTFNSTNYQIGTINIPASSGTNGSSSTIDLLNSSAIPALPIDRNGKRILPLGAGVQLRIGALNTPVTVGRVVIVTAIVEEY
jgi:hypothetical protein